MENGTYDRIIPRKSRSLFITNFSASLTNLASLLPQSHDCSYWESKKYWHLHRSQNINTLLCAYKTSTSLLTCEISLGLANVTCAWRLCGICPAITAAFILAENPTSSFFVLNLVTR